MSVFVFSTHAPSCIPAPPVKSWANKARFLPIRSLKFCAKFILFYFIYFLGEDSEFFLAIADRFFLFVWIRKLSWVKPHLTR